MHPWYLLRSVRLFCYWLTADKSSGMNFQQKIRLAAAVFVFLIVPVLLIALYNHIHVWNPVVGLDEDDRVVTFAQFFFPGIYWGCLFLAYKGVTIKLLMPAQVKQLFVAFDEASESLKIWRQFGSYKVRDRFELSVISQPRKYIADAKESSAREVVVREIANIAKDLHLQALYDDAITELVANKLRGAN